MGELDIFQGAHAEQDFVPAHTRINVGRHVVKRDAAESQLVDDGRTGFHHAVGGGAHLQRAGREPQLLRQVLGNGDRGRACVHQKGHWHLVDGAAGQIVVLVIAFEHHLIDAALGSGDGGEIGIFPALQPLVKIIGQEAEGEQPPQQDHALT